MHERQQPVPAPCGDQFRAVDGDLHLLVEARHCPWVELGSGATQRARERAERRDQLAPIGESPLCTHVQQALEQRGQLQRSDDVRLSDELAQQHAQYLQLVRRSSVGLLLREPKLQ